MLPLWSMCAWERMHASTLARIEGEAGVLFERFVASPLEQPAVDEDLRAAVRDHVHGARDRSRARRGISPVRSTAPPFLDVLRERQRQLRSLPASRDLDPVRRAFLRFEERHDLPDALESDRSRAARSSTMTSPGLKPARRGRRIGEDGDDDDAPVLLPRELEPRSIRVERLFEARVFFEEHALLSVVERHGEALEDVVSDDPVHVLENADPLHAPRDREHGPRERESPDAQGIEPAQGRRLVASGAADRHGERPPPARRSPFVSAKLAWRSELFAPVSR